MEASGDDRWIGWRGRRRKLSVVRLVQRLRDGILPAALEAVAVAVHLQDVDVVGEPVQQRSGEPFRAEDLGPLIEGQIGGDQDGAPLVALAEDLEEEFRSGGGQGDEAQFVDDQQVQAGQLALQVEQASFVPGLHQLMHQGGGGGEAHGQSPQAGQERAPHHPGSAPMHVPSFRETVLAQLGQRELRTAIEVDLAGETARARPLDADAKGALRDIHKRVGTAMLFESTGGQIDRVAHLPELRFALGEPDVETTTIDTAAAALAETAFFIRKAGTDGYRIHHQATLRKAVADLRASLDEETEVKPAIRRLVHQEFDQGGRIRKVYFPENSNAVGDDPRMTLVVVSPEEEWRENGPIAERINQWTRERGRSPRLYPAALVWCIRKPGRDLQDKVELWLAWQKVRSEIDAGTMGPEFERPELNAVSQQIRSAEEEAVEEVKASYRFVALGDSQAENGLKTIDLGAGYSRGGPTLSERVVAALNANALLNESVGAGYIERNWPPALQESGAWPLGSLRQSFLNGSLTRLLDPDAVLREKIREFVERGDFGLASGEQGQGSFSRVWYRETPAQDEVTFDSNTFLITSKAAERALAPPPEEKEPEPEREPQLNPGVQEAPGPYQAPALPEEQPPLPMPQKATLRLRGTVPPESWNMMGIRILTKLQSGAGLNLAVDLSVEVDSETLPSLRADILQALADLKLDGQVRIE